MAHKRQVSVNLSGIRISGHALEQFCERHKEEYGEEPILPEEEMRRILGGAREMTKPMGFISRFFYSKKSRYWGAHDWYFITDTRATIVITAYRRTQGAPRWRPRVTRKN